jgi:hypothetical protein
MAISDETSIQSGSILLLAGEQAVSLVRSHIGVPRDRGGPATTDDVRGSGETDGASEVTEPVPTPISSG